MEDETPALAADEDVRADDTDACEDGLCEIEHDGEVHLIPAALKGAFLRQADYTRKTQELAEHRRQLEVERQAHAQRAAADRGASHDRIQLAALDHQLDAFEGIDWDAYAAQDPQGAQAMWARREAVAQARDQLAYAVSHHETRAQLQAARDAAEAMTATGRQLAQEIEGWSPEVAGKLVNYARAFGVTLEELGQAADPRLWKLLHKAWRADQAGQQEAAEQAPEIRPAVLVAGGGAGGGGVRDELSTKEWMRRRNDQMAKAR